MKKDNKQRLFEMMERLNPEFSNSIDNTWAIFRISRGYGKCFVTSIDQHGINTCDYRVKYGDPSVIKFTLEDAKKLIRKNINIDEKIGVVNNKGVQKLFDWKIKFPNKFDDNGHEIGTEIAEEIKTKKPKLIIPVGISGSGKSMWIKSMQNSNTIIVSPDKIRKELTGNISDQTKNNEVFALAMKKTADVLNIGKDVIFDATNIKSKNRKSLMDYMKVHVDMPFEGFAKIFSVSPEIAKERIKKDIENGIDRSNVPDWVIDKQYQIFTNDVNLLEPDGFKIID